MAQAPGEGLKKVSTCSNAPWLDSAMGWLCMATYTTPCMLVLTGFIGHSNDLCCDLQSNLAVQCHWSALHCK